MYNKEKLYDEKIYPLMSEIIKICKEEDIQMLFSCFLKSDENGDFNCTTYIPSKEENCHALLNATKVIRNGYVISKPYISTTTIISKEEI